MKLIFDLKCEGRMEFQNWVQYNHLNKIIFLSDCLYIYILHVQMIKVLLETRTAF